MARLFDLDAARHVRTPRYRADEDLTVKLHEPFELCVHGAQFWEVRAALIAALAALDAMEPPTGQAQPIQ